jgi:hypothetical protein
MERDPLSLVSIIEELLEKSTRNPSADHVALSILKNSALTSPTSGCLHGRYSYKKTLTNAEIKIIFIYELYRNHVSSDTVLELTYKQHFQQDISKSFQASSPLQSSKNPLPIHQIKTTRGLLYRFLTIVH